MNSRLSIIVPTPDGEGLHALFESLYDQLGPGDEVLIIGDTHDGPLPFVEALIDHIGPPFRYIAHDSGHHCWGHCQINYGMTMATGDYLVFIDDDDQFTPDAFTAIRAAIAQQTEPRPLITFAQRVIQALELVGCQYIDQVDSEARRSLRPRRAPYVW